MGLDFTDVWPYNAMKKVTVDGQEMVRIPKIYVRNTQLPETSKYAGLWQYSIANEKLDDDWHVHPAFMYKGKELSALDFSCYEASKDASDNKKAASVSTTTYWERVTRLEAINACLERNTDANDPEKRGWRCWDIYCQALITRLFVIEKGEHAFELPSDGSNYAFHGINMPLGNPTAPIWLPGISNNTTGMYLYKNDGSLQMINTGLKYTTCGCPAGFSHLSGDKFDFGDIFIMEQGGGHAWEGWQDFDITYRNSRDSNQGGKEVCFVSGLALSGVNRLAQGSMGGLPPDGTFGVFSIKPPKYGYNYDQFREDPELRYAFEWHNTEYDTSYHVQKGSLRFRLVHNVD